MEIEEQIHKLEKYILKHDLQVRSISAAPVGWHIAHSLLTINIIIEALKRSDPAIYKWKFNFPRLLVYTINKIPRGKAKAPSVVRPAENFTESSLTENISVVRQKLKELDTLQKDHFFEHPFF